MKRCYREKTMPKLEYLKAIIPIVKLHHKDLRETAEPKELLGTGFFTGNPPFVVTAKHIFAMSPLGDGEAFAVTGLGTPGRLPACLIPEPEIHMSTRHDIAAFKWPNPDHFDVVSLALATEKVATDQDVLMVEFSESYFAKGPTTERAIFLRPLTHKGNVMLHYTGTVGRTAGTPAFVTSFPALQGASGAPVLRHSDLAIVGMMVGNKDSILHPAQVVEILDGEDYLEETKYLLPHGLGIAAATIIEFLSSIRV
jgi:hypothetical protein